MKMTPTIGLEIHAQLRTRTKMFCNSKNDPHETRPNVNVCPICMGHPGTLPVINKEAVKQVLRAGVALGGKVADFTEFDRKNYFYPDIPKGYQISQYKYPLISGGSLYGVELTRIHLEEDTARNIHMESGESLIDFNRAGVPLMELVTEPVITSGAQAVAFAKELQLLLRYCGASNADMEKGQMRIEANISVAEEGEKRGTKVEVKNLNSFQSVMQAIDFEIERQTTLLLHGESVVQETRGWSERRGETISQREKEESHDYRYFPEPDLPKLVLSQLPEFDTENIKRELPELPDERRERLRAMQIPESHIEIFIEQRELADFFDRMLPHVLSGEQRVTASNYLVSDVLGQLDGNLVTETPLTPESFASLMKMIDENIISSRGAKDVIAHLLREGGDAETVAHERGLLQVSDVSTLSMIVDGVLAHNERVVAEYKNGKENALQYLIGQAMKESRGSGNPKVFKELIEKQLR